MAVEVIQYNSLPIYHFISLSKFQIPENSDRQKHWFIGFCLSTALYPFSFIASLCEPQVCVHKLPASLCSGWFVTDVQVQCMLLMISPTARWHGTVRVMFKFLPLCTGTQTHRGPAALGPEIDKRSRRSRVIPPSHYDLATHLIWWLTRPTG